MAPTIVINILERLFYNIYKKIFNLFIKDKKENLKNKGRVKLR